MGNPLTDPVRPKALKRKWIWWFVALLVGLLILLLKPVGADGPLSYPAF